MRSSRILSIGITLLVFGLSFSSRAFSEDGSVAHQPAQVKPGAALLKLLESSAAALQTTRPDLASSLTAYASEVQARAKGNKEVAGKEKEKMGGLEGHIKTLNDAAAALRSSHPDLAADLARVAEQKTQKLAKKKAGK